MDNQIVKYETEDERESLINAFIGNGFILLGEKNITEGNFLVFGVEPEIVEDAAPLSEFELLKQELAEQKALMNALLGVTE